MKELDTKRKELELARVKVAQMDLELKVEELLNEIERLNGHIETQKQAVIRLKKELEG